MEFRTTTKTYEIEFIGITGVIEPVAEFILKTNSPAVGEEKFTTYELKTVKDTVGIWLNKYSRMAQTITGKKEQPVLFSLTAEAERFIKETAVEEVEKFICAAQAKKITEWMFAFEGELHGLHIDPVGLSVLESAVRPDVAEVRKFAGRNGDVRRYLKTHDGEKIERQVRLETLDGWRIITSQELTPMIAEAQRAEQAYIEERKQVSRMTKFNVGDLVVRIGADNKTPNVEKIIVVTRDEEYITSGTGWNVWFNKDELRLATSDDIAQCRKRIDWENNFIAASLDRGDKLVRELTRGEIEADRDVVE